MFAYALAASVDARRRDCTDSLRRSDCGWIGACPWAGASGERAMPPKAPKKEEKGPDGEDADPTEKQARARRRAREAQERVASPSLVVPYALWCVSACAGA